MYSPDPETPKPRAVKHGRHGTPEYRAWTSMKDRCCNPSSHRADRYGGRGITVCERWLSSFEAFYADMGPRPSSDHSLDRYPNNDSNYEPGNCRWATQREQNQNQERNRVLEFRGEKLCVAEWARRFGLDKACVRRRLNAGWSVEKTLATPSQHGKRRMGQLFTHHEETLTIVAWAKRTGIPPRALRSRLDLGWRLEDALTRPLANKTQTEVSL